MIGGFEPHTAMVRFHPERASQAIPTRIMSSGVKMNECVSIPNGLPRSFRYDIDIEFVGVVEPVSPSILLLLITCRYHTNNNIIEKSAAKICNHYIPSATQIAHLLFWYESRLLGSIDDECMTVLLAL